MKLKNQRPVPKGGCTASKKKLCYFYDGFVSYLYNVKWWYDRWMMNWKEFVRKKWLPNLGHVLACVLGGGRWLRKTKKHLGQAWSVFEPNASQIWYKGVTATSTNLVYANVILSIALGNFWDLAHPLTDHLFFIIFYGLMVWYFLLFYELCCLIKYSETLFYDFLVGCEEGEQRIWTL
jgi:hypothetical protein